MSAPLSIAVYFTMWWIVLFAILPFGVNRSMRPALDRPSARRRSRGAGHADDRPQGAVDDGWSRRCFSPRSTPICSGRADPGARSSGLLDPFATPGSVDFSRIGADRWRRPPRKAVRSHPPPAHRRRRRAGGFGSLMPSFKTTRRVRHSAANMFDLVADVERYPEFVPLCQSLRVRRRTDGAPGVEVLVCDMAVGYRAIREKFTSRVTLDRPQLQGARRICRGAVQPSRQHLDLSRRGATAGLPDRILHRLRVPQPHPRRLMGSMFDAAFRKFAQAFEARADVVYGRPPGSRRRATPPRRAYRARSRPTPAGWRRGPSVAEAPLQPRRPIRPPPRRRNAPGRPAFPACRRRGRRCR